MKAEEVKTKVCPFMIDYTFEANDCIATRYTNCICGECMAFTYTDKDKNEGDCARLYELRSCMAK